jgi:hypothetical protein
MGYLSSGDGQHQAIHHEVITSSFWHLNWDRHYQGGIRYHDARAVSQTIPPSLYLTNKPAFFGEVAWPAFGPDRAPQVGTIPAKLRYEAMISAPPPMPPGKPSGVTVR